MKDRDKRIAIFDLDGTVTSKDTYLEFIKYCKGSPNYYLGLFILSPFIILFYLKLLKNNKLKERFFSYFFKNEKVLDIEKKGEGFSEKVLPSLCYGTALDILDWHKKNKHDILILTASSDLWLQKWCSANSYQLISTKFQSKNGRLTGKINGKNCFGPQKKILLQDFFQNNPYDFSYGYGDSKADEHFLSIVDKPYLMALNEENAKKHWDN